MPPVYYVYKNFSLDGFQYVGKVGSQTRSEIIEGKTWFPLMFSGQERPQIKVCEEKLGGSCTQDGSDLTSAPSLPADQNKWPWWIKSA